MIRLVYIACVSMSALLMAYDAAVPAALLGLLGFGALAITEIAAAVRSVARKRPVALDITFHGPHQRA